MWGPGGKNGGERGVGEHLRSPSLDLPPIMKTVSFYVFN